MRADKANVPFDITVDYLISIFPADHKCPVLGIPMTWGDDTGRGTSPSLDRLIPELGYVPDNVEWVCQHVNSIKSNATAETLMKVALHYQKRLPQ